MDEKLKCPHKRIDHNGECLDCDEPVWVGGDELLEDALVHLKGANESGDPAAWIDHAIEKIETRLKSPRPIPGLQEAIDEAIRELKFWHRNNNKGVKDSHALHLLQAARQSGVPDGWVLVPREPTEEMSYAGLKTLVSNVIKRQKELKAASWAVRQETNAPDPTDEEKREDYLINFGQQLHNSGETDEVYKAMISAAPRDGRD